MGWLDEFSRFLKALNLVWDILFEILETIRHTEIRCLRSVDYFFENGTCRNKQDCICKYEAIRFKPEIKKLYLDGDQSYLL